MEISGPQFISSSFKRVFVINHLQNLIYGDNLRRNNCNIGVYDIKTREFLYEIDAGLTQYISCISISDCGNYLLVGTYGSGIIKLINTTTRTVIKEFTCHTHNIRCVTFGKIEIDIAGNLNGFIFSSAEDGYIKKMNFFTVGSTLSSNIKTFNIYNYEYDWVSCILFDSPNTIFYSTYHGDIVCINFITSEIICKININMTIWKIYFVNSDIIASDHYIDGEIHLFNRKTCEKIHTFKNNVKSHVSSCASPDGNFIIAKYFDMNDYSNIIIWEINTKCSLLNYNSGYSDTSSEIIISPNSKKIFSLEYSGLIREYNLYIVLKEKKDDYKLLLDGNILSLQCKNQQTCEDELDILFKITSTTTFYTDSNLNIVLKNSCNDIFTIETQDYNDWIECIKIIFERLQQNHYSLEKPEIVLNNYRFDIFQCINIENYKNRLSSNIIKKILKYLFIN